MLLYCYSTPPKTEGCHYIRYFHVVSQSPQSLALSISLWLRKFWINYYMRPVRLFCVTRFSWQNLKTTTGKKNAAEYNRNNQLWNTSNPVDVLVLHTFTKKLLSAFLWPFQLELSLLFSQMSAFEIGACPVLINVTWTSCWNLNSCLLLSVSSFPLIPRVHAAPLDLLSVILCRSDYSPLSSTSSK